MSQKGQEYWNNKQKHSRREVLEKTEGPWGRGSSFCHWGVKSEIQAQYQVLSLSKQPSLSNRPSAVPAHCWVWVSGLCCENQGALHPLDTMKPDLHSPRLFPLLLSAAPVWPCVVCSILFPDAVSTRDREPLLSSWVQRQVITLRWESALTKGVSGRWLKQSWGRIRERNGRWIYDDLTYVDDDLVPSQPECSLCHW